MPELVSRQFLDVLDEVLRPGSYKFCYADTDFFMSALTRDQITECARLELAQCWKNEILKVGARTISGWFIVTSPKCYVIVEKDFTEF
jgi:hypothetical protein